MGEEILNGRAPKPGFIDKRYSALVVNDMTETHVKASTARGRAITVGILAVVILAIILVGVFH